MSQIHKKFTADQIEILFRSYETGHICRAEIEKSLGIGKTRFFALLKKYRTAPESFTIEYQRKNQPRLNVETEKQIRIELHRDKQLIDDNDLPISSCNYAALTDRLKKSGIQVSTTTVIKRAIQQDVTFPKRKQKTPMIVKYSLPQLEN